MDLYTVVLGVFFGGPHKRSALCEGLFGCLYGLTFPLQKKRR